MGFRDFHPKLKALRLRKFLLGGGKSKLKDPGTTKKPSWMTPVSHGYSVVEDGSLDFESPAESKTDPIRVQREQFGELEMWLFGVSDAQVGDGIMKYLQSHLFDKNPKQSQITVKSKDTMKRAYLNARSKIREDSEKTEEAGRLGTASAIVINGEKLVTANMGDYKAVVCKDGVAYQLSSKHRQKPKRHWSRRLISLRIFGRGQSSGAATKSSRGSEAIVGTEKIDSDTEFVILGSTGIWEVMKIQEAVNLIRHIEDPQEAAECLAKEALTRFSKSSISCLVIRFD